MNKGLDIGVFGARGIPSTYSGYETFLTVLLPELADRGHRVTIYCRRGEVEETPDFRGVRKVFLPAIASKQLSTLSHGAVAAAAARRSGHDVVLAVNVANAAFCLASRLTGQRTVLNTDGQEWLRGKWGRAAKAYFRWSAKIARHSASALIADGIGMRDIYAEQFGAPSTVIPYCWTKIDREERLEGLQGLGVEPYGYFLIAGRLVPENNIQRVARSYVESGVRTPLVVLGVANYDSPVVRELRGLADANPGLILGGHVSDRAAYATMVRLARAYFHTHSVGGINPSLLESMGSGAEIVALETVFNREALGETGSYFSDFSHELPALMRKLEAANPDHCIRELARDRARERYSLEEICDAYEGLFVTVARRSRWARTALQTQWDHPESTLLKALEPACVSTPVGSGPHRAHVGSGGPDRSDSRLAEVAGGQAEPEKVLAIATLSDAGNVAASSRPQTHASQIAMKRQSSTKHDQTDISNEDSIGRGRDGHSRAS